MRYTNSVKEQILCRLIVVTAGLLIGMMVGGLPLEVEAASLGGELELGMDYHRADEELGTDGLLHLAVSSWAGRDIHLQAGVDLRFDETEVRGEIDEARLTYYGLDTDLIFGWQKVTWGAVDHNSPVDTINPRDLTRPLAEDNRIAVPAVRVRHYYPEVELDVVWQPYATPTRFAEAGERWALPIAQIVDDPELPSRKLENSVLGVRASRHTLNIDYAVSYFRGLSQNPIPTDLEGDNWKHYLQQILGGEIVCDAGGYILRADLALIFPESGDFTPDDHLRYAATGEYNLTSELMILGGIQGKTEKSQGAKHNLMAGLEYELDFYTQLSLGVAYGLNEGDYLINPEYTHDLADGLEFKVGANYFGGSDEGLYGNFRDEDQVYISVSQAFNL